MISILDYNIKNNDKNNFGIVYTPNSLVDKILDLIPKKYYQDPSNTWLDIGAGNGAFSLNLFSRLNIELSNNIIDNEKRKTHIIKNMIYMCEIYPSHIEELKQKFGSYANIIQKDFLALNKYEYSPFDFIIGNPPFNINGQLKTPTNNSIKKTDDGKQIYVDFVKKSLELLYEDGYLNLIIPSLWLKPDKAGLYEILTNKKIEKLVCLSTTQTQKEFNYKAQTPTTYFLIQNINNYLINNIESTNISNKTINIYDKITNKFIKYNLKYNNPIPTHGINIINKINFFTNKYGSLKVIKTTTCSKHTKLNNERTQIYNYKNIKTCLLENNPLTNNNTKPKLVINYSNIEQQYYNEPKLIMAHKMYGFPFYDISGSYGISARDNYLILEKYYKKNDLLQIQAFLSTKTALFIFSTTNYRMRYLERYAFEFIPNIILIPEFPNLINCNTIEKDNLIYIFFSFSKEERENIEKYSKNYDFFI